MPRTRASVPPEAIRIEDDVWQEAFARREPARPRLHAIDGGAESTAPVIERRPPILTPHERATERPRPVPAPRRSTVAAPRTAAAAPPRPTVAAPRPAAPTMPAAAGGVPGRRTVTIRGYGAERNLPWPDASSRRPQRRAYERAGFRPDRVALWAVMLSILLVIVAIASPHG